MPDHGDSDKQVEQACTQSAAPSFNQCSRGRSSNTRWCFREENTRHAAAFRTDCKRLMVLAGRLALVQLPLMMCSVYLSI